MSDFKDDLKNEDYQVEVASDTNAAEPLETKFACKSISQAEHCILLTIYSVGTMAGRKGVLEGHAILYDLELGSIE